MKKYFYVVGVLIGLGAAPSYAAVVYLKDGSQVRGTIVSATARDVRLHTANGDLTIAAEQIRRVDYTESEPTVVPTSNAEPDLPLSNWQRSSIPENDSGRQMFSLGLGFATPLSRVNFGSTGGGSADNGNTGFLIGTQYHYYVSPRLAAGLDLEFMNRSVESTQNLLPDSNTDVYGNSMLLLATLRYSLTARGMVRPYILVGLGGNRTSTTVESAPNPGFAWSDTDTTETRTLVDDSRWGLAETARVGLDFMFNDPAMFSLEFGWTGISNGDSTATRAGHDLGLDSVTGNLSVLTVAARWGWRF